MTVHTASEVAGYWTGAGGPANRAAEWVGIAMGESSLDDAAVSSAGAVGLWQIMPFNASVGGGSVSDLYDPGYNAKVAVLMSGGGTNCAAWDSCYADIYRSGRYSYLAYPEVGSADYHNAAIAAVALGVDGVSAALPEPALDIGAAIGSLGESLQQLINQVIPALHNDTRIDQSTISAMYQPGWKSWTYGAR